MLNCRVITVQTMGLFVCGKCQCVENTALGWWWSKDLIKLTLPPDMKEYEEHKGLCSECLPADAKFPDGKLVGAKGVWHRKFPKIHIDDFIKSEEGETYVRIGDRLQDIPSGNKK